MTQQLTETVKALTDILKDAMYLQERNQQLSRSREISQQRCFKIPRKKLDLFLVQLNMMSDQHLNLEAGYIFHAGTNYDVVVNYYGSYPYREKQLIEFVEKL